MKRLVLGKGLVGIDATYATVGAPGQFRKFIKDGEQSRYFRNARLVIEYEPEKKPTRETRDTFMPLRGRSR